MSTHYQVPHQRGPPLACLYVLAVALVPNALLDKLICFHHHIWSVFWPLVFQIASPRRNGHGIMVSMI